MPKFRTKNALFRYFWLEIQKAVVIFETAHSNLSKCKISNKNNNNNKNFEFEYVWDRILKYYCYI